MSAATWFKVDGLVLKPTTMLVQADFADEARQKVRDTHNVTVHQAYAVGPEEEEILRNMADVEVIY